MTKPPDVASYLIHARLRPTNVCNFSDGSTTTSMTTTTTCSIDMKTLSSLDIPSLLSRNMNMTDLDFANFYNIKPGGSWAPVHCKPTLRGSF